jgi:hypothetical protein
MRRIATAVVTAGIAVASTFSTPLTPAAHAADNGAWSVYPTSNPKPGETFRPFFLVDLRAGATTQDSVTVTNKTDKPATFNLYVADAFNTAEGGFALKPRNEPKTDMATWVNLPVAGFTLDPQHKVDIPFSIVVPANATPGDHTAGIVAENTTPTAAPANNGAVGVDVMNAVGVRIYGRVPGTLNPSLSITKVSLKPANSVGSMVGAPEKVTLQYTVVNTGNTRLTATATAKVHPVFGPSKTLGARKLPELLPKGSATIKETVTGVLPLGRLSADITADAPGARAKASAAAWAVPWLLLLAAIGLGVLWYLRRRKGHTRPPEPVGGSTPNAPVLTGSRS